MIHGGAENCGSLWGADGATHAGDGMSSTVTGMALGVGIGVEVAAAQEAARRAADEARKARWEKRRAEFTQKLSNLGHHAKKS